MAAATITRAEYEKKREHGYAGRRGVDGMAPADEHGDVWWLEYVDGRGTVLAYGWVQS